MTVQHDDVVAVGSLTAVAKRKASDKKRESKKAVLKPLGAQVRRLRLDREFSQEYLAERAALNYKYLGRVELAKANPTADVLVRLAKALSVPISELFDTLTQRPDFANRLTPSDLREMSAAVAALSAIIERVRSNTPPPAPTRARAPKRPRR